MGVSKEECVIHWFAYHHLSAECFYEYIVTNYLISVVFCQASRDQVKGIRIS